MEILLLIMLGFIANYLGHISLRLMDLHSVMRLQQGLIDRDAYEKEIRRTPMVRFGFVLIFLIIAVVAAALVYWPESHKYLQPLTGRE